MHTFPAIALLGAALVTSAEAQELGRSPGQVHPDLELPTIERDRTVVLSSLRGKRVLLIEFASW